MKFIECWLYKELARGYPAINITIFDFHCILVFAYSVLAFILIYAYLKNKSRDRNGLTIMLIILIIPIIILIRLAIVSLTYSFPLNVRVNRMAGALLSIAECIIIAYKAKFVKR